MAGDFTEHLVDVLTSEIDRVAPLKTVMRSSNENPINRFLNQEAKQKYQSLERHWKKTGKERDQQISVLSMSN